MFTINTIIDAVQNTKKQVVNTFVTDEAIAKELNAFVDAQTAYTRSALESTSRVASNIQREILGKVSAELGKFLVESQPLFNCGNFADWAKAFAGKK